MGIIRTFKQFFRRLQLRFATWVVSWDVWWKQHTPNPEPFSRYEDHTINKDRMYWSSIVTITENKAFMNEMYELQKHIDDMIRVALRDGEDYGKIRDRQLILHGAMKINEVLVKADQKLKQYLES